MPLRTQVSSRSTASLSFKDYAGSPVTVSIGTLVPGSFVRPRQRMKSTSIVRAQSSSGQAPYANPEHGITEDLTGSFQIWMTDLKNATDAGPTSFVLAMANGVISGTPFSGYTLTSQLTGGGKFMAQMNFAEPDTGGTTHTTTCNVQIDSVEDADVEGTSALTVNYTVLGAIATT